MSVTARQCFPRRRTHRKEDVFDVCVTFARPSRGFVSIFLSIVRVGPGDTRHTWHPVPGIPQPARLDHAGSCLSSLVEASPPHRSVSHGAGDLLLAGLLILLKFHLTTVAFQLAIIPAIE